MGIPQTAVPDTEWQRDALCAREGYRDLMWFPKDWKGLR